MMTSENDAELLASLEQKLTLLRDRTRGVAERYTNGLFLWGEGGTSKSYTVEETLKSMGKAFKLSNSRITGKGLFVLLRENADAIHLLEDVETLFGDKTAFGVLRSALWGQSGADGRQERTVIWQTAIAREEFVFSGGIILISNCPLDNVPELRALKTRIPTVQYQPTNEEVAALMRKISSKGHRLGQQVLSPAECLEVAHEITTRFQRIQRNLDLRLLVNTFNDVLQWKNGSAQMHWQELLDSRLKERVLSAEEVRLSRSQRKTEELDIVREIAGLPCNDRLAAWIQRTGKSQAAMYRRLDDLKKVSQFSVSNTSVNN
jgi:hypothetical protein